LHVLVTHGGDDVHAIGAPAHVAPPQASLYVHRFPSSHRASPARQRHVPSWFAQVYVNPPQATDWHSVWLAALQVRAVPPPQLPLAPLPVQPAQLRVVVNTFASPHRSAHAPPAVPHPDDGAHVETQHSLVAPTVHAVTAGVHAHGTHAPPASQTLVHEPG
jgi:hypothetical protein